MTKIFKRRIIREKVLQTLYAFELNNSELERHINEIFAETDNDSDKDFGLSLIYKVIANRKLSDEMIEKKTSNWEMDRIALIDKILLRMGISEFLFFEDIPTKVTINEILEISKVFSTENSSKFLNGVLDSILNDLQKQGKVKKSGRGLIDKTISKFSDKKN